MSTLMYDPAEEHFELYEDILEQNDIAFAKENLLGKIHQLKEMESMTLVTANEGLWQFIKGCLTSIGNIMGHIVTLFTTNVFKFYKSLKRTEIRYYNNSNKVSMLRIFSQSYDELSNIEIPFPNGMTVTYMEALDKTIVALTNLDIMTRANLAVTVSDKILKGLKSGSVMNDIIKSGVASSDTTNVKDVVEAAKKCIDEKKNTSNDIKTFKELFISIADFKKCNDMALDCDKFVDIVNAVHKKMGICSDNFTEIVKVIERSAGNGVTKDDVENLSTLAYTLADTFDMFSMMMFNFHKLEHNLVEVYRKIRKELSL